MLDNKTEKSPNYISKNIMISILLKLEIRKKGQHIWIFFLWILILYNVYMVILIRLCWFLFKLNKNDELFKNKVIQTVGLDLKCTMDD